MTDKKTSTKKAAYTRKAEAKLEEAVAKLDGVKAKVKGAVADQQIELESQLAKAQNEADTHLDTVKRRLARVKDAGEDSWEHLQEGVENAWEDLYGAIKKIVTRLT